MERVGHDLRHPHQARLHVLDEEQVHGTEQQSAQTHCQPDLTDVLHEVAARGV